MPLRKRVGYQQEREAVEANRNAWKFVGKGDGGEFFFFFFFTAWVRLLLKQCWKGNRGIEYAAPTPFQILKNNSNGTRFNEITQTTYPAASRRWKGCIR